MVAKRKSKGRGGYREGAGRKPVLKDARSVTLAVESADYNTLKAMAMKSSVSVAEVIRKAIKAHLRRRGRT